MINVETLERETTRQCFTCKHTKLHIQGVDFNGRLWRANRCPDCMANYKKNWARANYGRTAVTRKIQRILGEKYRDD